MYVVGYLTCLKDTPEIKFVLFSDLNEIYK